MNMLVCNLVNKLNCCSEYLLTDLNLDGWKLCWTVTSRHVLFFSIVGKPTFFCLHVKIEVTFYHARIRANILLNQMNAQSNVICHKPRVEVCSNGAVIGFAMWYMLTELNFVH